MVQVPFSNLSQTCLRTCGHGTSSRFDSPWSSVGHCVREQRTSVRNYAAMQITFSNLSQTRLRTRGHETSSRFGSPWSSVGHCVREQRTSERNYAAMQITFSNLSQTCLRTCVLGVEMWCGWQPAMCRRSQWSVARLLQGAGGSHSVTHPITPVLMFNEIQFQSEPQGVAL